MVGVLAASQEWSASTTAAEMLSALEKKITRPFVGVSFGGNMNKQSPTCQPHFRVWPPSLMLEGHPLPPVAVIVCERKKAGRCTCLVFDIPTDMETTLPVLDASIVSFRLVDTCINGHFNAFAAITSLDKPAEGVVDFGANHADLGVNAAGGTPCPAYGTVASLLTSIPFFCHLCLNPWMDEAECLPGLLGTNVGAQSLLVCSFMSIVLLSHGDMSRVAERFGEQTARALVDDLTSIRSFYTPTTLYDVYPAGDASVGQRGDPDLALVHAMRVAYGLIDADESHKLFLLERWAEIGCQVLNDSFSSPHALGAASDYAAPPRPPRAVNRLYELFHAPQPLRNLCFRSMVGYERRLREGSARFLEGATRLSLSLIHI